MNLHLTVFGKYCSGRRRDCSRTIAMMADALGVDTAYLSAVERGEIIPPECYVEKVAAYFNDKIEYVKVKALKLPPTIEVSYSVDHGQRARPWPSNVVSIEAFRQKRWQKTSTPPTA